MRLKYIGVGLGKGRLQMFCSDTLAHCLIGPLYADSHCTPPWPLVIGPFQPLITGVGAQAAQPEHIRLKDSDACGNVGLISYANIEVSTSWDVAALPFR